MNQVGVQGRPGARRRLHDGAQAVGGRRRSAPSSSPRSSTRPACPPGVFNLVNGDGADGGRRALLPPRRRHGVVHRLDARRHRGRRAAAATVKRVAPGARRQVGQHRPRRRRPGRASWPATWRACASTPASRATRRRACSCRRRAWTRRPPPRPRRPPKIVRGRPDRRRRRSIGPVVSARAVRRSPAANRARHRRGRDAGRRRARAAGRARQRGYYVRPTVFADVDHRHDDRPGGDLRPGARR